MNPRARCRKQSAYIHYFCISLDAFGVSANTIGPRGYLARPGGRYNRINHKFRAFPRKRIFVIYTRWMVRSAKESEQRDRPRWNIAMRQEINLQNGGNDFLESAAAGNVLIPTTINCIAIVSLSQVFHQYFRYLKYIYLSRKCRASFTIAITLFIKAIKSLLRI